MENLVIEGTIGNYFIPNIYLDVESGICEISGEAYLEDTVTFFLPIMKWLKEYFQSGKQIIFNFKLSYFNTSVSKSIYEIIKLLEIYNKEGGMVEINWYYEKDDLEMIEDIEDYQFLTSLDINTIVL